MNDIKVEIGIILFGIQILLLAGISNLIEHATINVIVVILAFGLQCFGIIKLNEKLTQR